MRLSKANATLLRDKALNEEKAIELYLDWVNNYLTVDCFALDNNMSKEKAYEVIAKGSTAHKKSVLRLKTQL